MDFNFNEKPGRQRQQKIKYLSFLPKSLRQNGLYAVILNLCSVFFSLLFYPGLQKQIPLFYSLPETQQLVNKEYFFILPLLATLINFFHFSLIKTFKNAKQTVLKLLILITLIIEALILAIILRIFLILR